MVAGRARPVLDPHDSLEPPRFFGNVPPGAHRPRQAFINSPLEMGILELPSPSPNSDAHSQKIEIGECLGSLGLHPRRCQERAARGRIHIHCICILPVPLNHNTTSLLFNHHPNLPNRVSPDGLGLIRTEPKSVLDPNLLLRTSSAVGSQRHIEFGSGEIQQEHGGVDE